MSLLRFLREALRLEPLDVEEMNQSGHNLGNKQINKQKHQGITSFHPLPQVHSGSRTIHVKDPMGSEVFMRVLCSLD